MELVQVVVVHMHLVAAVDIDWWVYRVQQVVEVFAQQWVYWQSYIDK